jgi:hypothetical protein
MDYTEHFKAILDSRLGQIALPRPGVVTQFDSTYYTAVIEVSTGRGKEFALHELPWPIQMYGAYIPAPSIGTQVIVGYLGGNPDRPYVACIYDAFWKDSYKQTLTRNKNTYSTRIDKSLL